MNDGGTVYAMNFSACDEPGARGVRPNQQVVASNQVDAKRRRHVATTSEE
jgi:hypothetical protein